MRSSLRTVALWVFLILLFVAFYSFFSAHPGERDWSGWLPWVVIVSGVGMVVLFGRKGRKGAQLNQEGVGLLARGRVVAALEKFQEARQVLKENGVLGFNVGICRLELWHLEEAERELLAVRAQKELAPQVRHVLPSHLALVAALGGRQAEALERLEEARGAHPHPEDDALRVLAEAVLACRREDWAEARALLEQPVTHLLGGRMRGLREALLAWSVERGTGERRHVDPVSLFGEASPDKLRESWPRLVDFLLERARQVA